MPESRNDRVGFAKTQQISNKFANIVNVRVVFDTADQDMASDSRGGVVGSNQHSRRDRQILTLRSSEDRTLTMPSPERS